MPTLHIDLETWSSVNLKKSGIYKYVESPDFEILLMAYRVGKKPVRLIDFTAGEKMPAKLVKALSDPRYVKKSWNAVVERRALSKKLGYDLPTDQWRCSMAKAAYNGYPLKLETASKVINRTTVKRDSGKAGIKLFCVPCKATKKNGGRTRNYPHHFPADWEEFKAYCIDDVYSESEIDARLPFDMPDIEQEIYQVDQLINDTGVAIDAELVARGIKLFADNKKVLLDEASRLTGLMNPNSRDQLMGWLQAEKDDDGLEITDLKKDTVKYLVKHFQDNATISRMLAIRQELALSSVTKLRKMADMMGAADIIRGLLQYYGAIRTGRWAGRGVQVQNLAGQNIKLAALELMRDCVRAGFDRDTIHFMYGSISSSLKLLLRTCFIPRPGRSLIAADYSAIEANILAWLAKETWRQTIFAGDGKIYEASASRMFKIPVELITPESDARKKGKVSELALGYQGAVGALIQMGALKMGLKEEELLPIVGAWRRENPNIVALWKSAQRAFIGSFSYPGKWIAFADGRLKVCYSKNRLIMRLPSGRYLFYPEARLRDGRIEYKGPDQKTGRWSTLSLYGGKIIENATQAIARDLLAGSIVELTRRGLRIVMHVHDELIAECKTKFVESTKRLISKVMNNTPLWASGLVLKSSIFDCAFYRKNKD